MNFPSEYFIHMCRSEATHSEKAKKLVSVIEERGSAAYCHFVSVLCKSDRYKHFGELLKGQGMLGGDIKGAE